MTSARPKNVSALLVKTRGGFYVGFRPDKPAQRQIREEAMLSAQAVLRKAGIEWSKGEKK